jgi:prepilin-type N-terminal cleavage/methylation domain-containing protein
MRRGFTLFEMMVVLGIVGIGSALALGGMSDQVREARARSEAVAMLQKLKAEHRQAKERMNSLQVESLDAGSKVRFTFREAKDCTGDTVRAESVVEYDFARLNLREGDSSLCFGNDGALIQNVHQPAGPTPTLGRPDVHIAAAAKDTIQVTRLRIDKTGINDVGRKSFNPSQKAELLDFLSLPLVTPTPIPAI